MITKLMTIASGAGMTELQIKAAAVIAKLMIAAALGTSLFVGGCVHGQSNRDEYYLKQQIKAQKKEAVTVSKRNKEAEKADVAGSARLAVTRASKEKLNETLIDNPNCQLTSDELQRFNELAASAAD